MSGWVDGLVGGWVNGLVWGKGSARYI